MKQIRSDREKLWYVVSHPFTRPIVTGPIHDRYDAIALACKRTDNKSLITHISRGESWVGGEVVCSAYRLHVNGWTALAPTVGRGGGRTTGRTHNRCALWWW